jgi:hypothetical protein
MTDRLARIEPPLRGLLVALVTFLAVSGFSTLLVSEPGRAVQVVQSVHTFAGFALILTGLAYIAVHVTDTMSGPQNVARQLPPSIRRGVAFLLALLAFALLDLGGWPRAILNPLLGLTFVGLVVAVGVQVVQKRHAIGKSPALSGGALLVPTGLAALTGLGVASGTKLYTDLLGSPWFLHVALSAVGLVLMPLHVAGSVRRRRHRGEVGRSYSWGAPFLGVAVPALAGLGATAGVLAIRAPELLAPPPEDPLALRAVDDKVHRRVPNTCGLYCHKDATLTWSESAHHFAANNPVFTGILMRTAETEGPERLRFCLGCHAPHAPDPVSVDFETLRSSPGYNAGVTCVSCHRAEVDGHGDGGFRTVPLFADPDDALISDLPLFADVTVTDSRGLWDIISRRMRLSLTSSRLERHRRSWRFATGSPEGCLPCHVQTLSQPTDGRLSYHIQDHYDSWKTSEAAAAGVGCVDCHMSYFVSESAYLVADHRFSGGSTWLAERAGGQPSLDATLARLRGGGIVELAPRLDGATLEVSSSLGPAIGHSFPNGPTDLIQVWLRARVTGADGRVLLDVGANGPAGAPRLGHEFQDSAGAVITDHRLHDVARVVDRGQVRPGAPHVEVLPLAEAPVGAIEVELAWMYRRLDPALAAELAGEELTLPAVEIARYRGTLGPRPGPGGAG